MASGPPAPPPTIVVPGQGWVDVASRVVVQVGFPVVVAGVLLWFLLTRFQTNMDSITSRMANNTTVVATLIEEERSTVAELQKQTASLDNVVKAGQALIALHEQELAELRGIRGARKPPAD